MSQKKQDKLSWMDDKIWRVCNTTINNENLSLETALERWSDTQDNSTITNSQNIRASKVTRQAIPCKILTMTVKIGSPETLNQTWLSSQREAQFCCQEWRQKNKVKRYKTVREHTITDEEGWATVKRMAPEKGQNQKFDGQQTITKALLLLKRFCQPSHRQWQLRGEILC